ncbi:FecR domain-containing protein [Sorangium sp. So ce542]|uniref:FecR domain-containing protein n=1 Tax=Sorangium sp. So ce542 TaxID=3133316 RepID=UPI003F60C467
MAEPKPEVPPEVALQRLTALAREAGAVARTDAALARGRARLIEEVERPVLPLAPRRVWLIPAALAPLLLILGLVWLRPAARLSYRIDDAAPADSYVLAEASGATARFSEGTTIRFAPGARGRIAAVTERGAQIHLESGAAHFEVVHLPEAEWVAEAGPFTVTVTGTEFELRWQHERLELTMESGSVAVRGPLVWGGVTLHGGQRLVADTGRRELTIVGPRADIDASAPEVGAPAEPEASARIDAPGMADAPEPDAPEPDAPAKTDAPARADAPAAAAPVPQTYRERVARGDFAGAIADAEARGIDATIDASPLSEVAALADAARYTGRNDLARRALLAERSRFAGSPEARSAAFLLGRMVEASSPAEAISWYEQYLSESPGGPLAAEALGRKMLVTRSSRGKDAARPVAEEYLARHPHGAFAGAAAEILGPP